MTAAIAPPARRLSRGDLLRLGQAGRAWEFVPIGLQAVRIAPEDWGMRVLLAANFARLGLKIAAGEQLAALPDEVRSDDSVRGLTGVVEGLREDRLAPERLEAQVYLNLEALRGLDLAAELPRWKGQAREWEWFLAADENIVRRRGEQWVGLGDQRAAAAAFGREPLAKTTVHPFAVGGDAPPGLLPDVAGPGRAGKDGGWPGVYVVYADPVECMNGLAHADLRSVLSQERTVALVGPDASERLLNDLRARLTGRINGAYIPLSRLGTPASPRVSEMLDTAEAEQVAEHERLVREVTALYAGRDIAWWRERFASGRPLRILVPSCRYTTFVQHAAADLVEALKRQGHEADLLFEADDSFRFSTLAYLRAISRLKPDLMVLINYMRQHIGEWVPRELPFVTWIQDAMPHLFDPALGRTLGDTDFVVGYLHPALIARCCYPKERTWATHIGASESKFHPGPVDPDRHRRSECEIALVSQHSQTPDAMHHPLPRGAPAGASGRPCRAGRSPATWRGTEPCASTIRGLFRAPR